MIDSGGGALVFPAYAGMSRRSSVMVMAVGRFPRLRGDEPQPSAAELARREFSPPTRG